MTMLPRLTRIEGFTLIELLVVIFIISIVTSTALLRIRYNENKQLETAANDMRQTITLAQEQALLQPQMLGIALGRHSYQFTTVQSMPDGKPPQWIVLKDSVLAKHVFPEHIALSVQVGKQSLPVRPLSTTPQIVISTNGDMTPFTIYIGKQGEKPRYAVIGHADGSITQELVS